MYVQIFTESITIPPYVVVTNGVVGDYHLINHIKKALFLLVIYPLVRGKNACYDFCSTVRVNHCYFGHACMLGTFIMPSLFVCSINELS